MAKYRRYRRFYRRKAKWSSRISYLNDQQTVPANQSFFLSRDLATNPAQSTTTVSQKYTVKNIRMQFNLEGEPSGNSVGGVRVFVMFIPQGFTTSATTPEEHPEWIMAYRYVGDPSPSNAPGYGPINVFTRLARTLDTGDRIVWLVTGQNDSSSTANILRIRGLVKYNTKAN